MCYVNQQIVIFMLCVKSYLLIKKRECAKSKNFGTLSSYL